MAVAMLEKKGSKEMIVKSPRTPVTQPSRTTTGIDISNWQGGFNPALATNKPGFVIIKSSEGAVADPSFNKFYSASVGKVPVIGSYHYLRSDVGLADQLRTALSLNAGKQIDFYAVDFEGKNNNLTPQFASSAIAYVNALHAMTGKPVYLYTNQSLYQQYFKNTNVPLWLSDPSGTPISGSPTFVQNAFNAPAAQFGVTGSQGVDTNIYPGTLGQLETSLRTGQGPKVNWGDLLASIPNIVAPTAGDISLPSMSFGVPSLGGTDQTQTGGTQVANKPAGTNPLVSVNLLPQNVTSFLSSPDIGTTVIFFIIGTILLIIGLLMLRPSR